MSTYLFRFVLIYIAVRVVAYFFGRVVESLKNRRD